MIKKYIIVDSNNNWLATATDEKEARQALNGFVKMGKKEQDYYGMEIGNDIWIFKAVEIIRACW